MAAMVRFGPASEGVRSEARRPPRRKARRGGAAILLAALTLLVMTASALAATGDLTQPAATSSCWSETGAGPCADGKALVTAVSVAISPDGKNVYVAARGGGVAVFSRNTTTGVLTQLAGTAGCVSETGSSGACTDGRALDGAQAVAVSPDGKNVYVASVLSDAVARFNRVTTGPNTGRIFQPAAAADGCVSETGAGPCADGRALDAVSSVAVSPDGKSVYVTSPGAADGVARFNRTTTGLNTGRIAQPTGGASAGCWTDSGSGGLCADGKALGGAYSVTVSPDNKSVYVAARDSSAVTRFSRNTTNGAIVQTPNCVSETGFGPCTDGKALAGASSVVVSPDGKSVYVGSTSSRAVARFNRNTTTGAITQPAAGTAGCVSETGAGPCADGRALAMVNSAGSRFVAVSGDGKNVYVASSSTGDGAVARFNRTTTGPATGAITQPAAAAAGCISEFGASGTCADGRALRGATSVAVSASGRHVYVASFVSAAVALFNRAP